jgi:hypothetical protein
MEAVEQSETPPETPNNAPTQQGNDVSDLFDVEETPTRSPNRLVAWVKRLWPFGREKPNRPRAPNFVELYKLLDFGGRDESKRGLFDVEDVVARAQYGPLIVKGYLGLVALQTIVPLLLWTAVTWGQPSSFSSGLRDLKDFVVAVSAGLAGVSGLAGFVIGRYFRERAGSA